ncbi:MAG: M48 family peptidase, partial [Candidatus Nanopelagicaceae bacterium]
MLLNILIIIVILGYLIEVWLDYLNQSTARNPLDPKIANLYDPKERERSIEYSATKSRLGFYSSSFSTAIMILALGLGWFAKVDNWVRDRFDNQIVISLAFIGSLSVISWVLNLPFQLYSIFGIEERYGFNKTTPKTFITDTIKGTLLSILIGGALLS